MRRLIWCNVQCVTVGQGEKLSPEQEELALVTVTTAGAFLFTVGFHTARSDQKVESDAVVAPPAIRPAG